MSLEGMSGVKKNRSEQSSEFSETAVNVAVRGLHPDALAAVPILEEIDRESRPELREAIGQKALLFTGRNRKGNGAGGMGYRTYKESRVQQDIEKLQESKTGQELSRQKMSLPERVIYDQNKRLAQVMERTLAKTAHFWFGEDASSGFVSEFTDTTQGIDAILILNKTSQDIPKARDITHMYGLDFTYEDRPSELLKKVSKNINGVVNGRLSNPMYINFNGEWVNGQTVPRLIFPLASTAVEEYAQAIGGNDVAFDITEESRAAILLLSIRQLEREKEYALITPRELFEPYSPRSVSATDEEWNSILEEQRTDMVTVLDQSITVMRTLWTSQGLATVVPIYDRAQAALKEVLDSDSSIESAYDAALEKRKEDLSKKKLAVQLIQMEEQSLIPADSVPLKSAIENARALDTHQEPAPVEAAERPPSQEDIERAEEVVHNAESYVHDHTGHHEDAHRAHHAEHDAHRHAAVEAPGFFSKVLKWLGLSALWTAGGLLLAPVIAPFLAIGAGVWAYGKLDIGATLKGALKSKGGGGGGHAKADHGGGHGDHGGGHH